jgi:CRISPR-associated exonuclease Cas4
MTTDEGRYARGSVNGTMVWYFTICKRQVWLISHQLTPDQENDNVVIGRFLHENTYQRDKHEIAVGNVKIDLVQASRDQVLVAEIKKSSRSLDSARLQLKYYLYVLKQYGVDVQGMLLVPEERKREQVSLSAADIEEIEGVIDEIVEIVNRTLPPEPIRTKWCRPCAYAEFCWA